MAYKAQETGKEADSEDSKQDNRFFYRQKISRFKYFMLFLIFK